MTLKKSQSSGPEADTLILGLGVQPFERSASMGIVQLSKAATDSGHTLTVIGSLLAGTSYLRPILPSMLA